ncbi:hypothetical protein DCAR_0100727 [Daucus carota subsp. sativus]|uniref:Uncharacterized protein n=1 Tax=Daucus carota subsp. sativus TaxID=79200 RepID=A0A166FVL9_DAUCS|nr:hypothetical protein DCAR_0100727 [Daucus carota subsp. sativus]
MCSREFRVEVSEIRNVVFWKDEVSSEKKNTDSLFSSKSSQAQTVEDSVKSSLHPEVMSVGALSNKSDDKSVGSSVELLQDSCDDSINYIEPVSEELRYRQARMKNWNRVAESGTSLFSGEKLLGRRALMNLPGTISIPENGIAGANVSSTITRIMTLFPMIIKSKGGRMRKGRKFGCFDKNRRQKRKKEVVPDWMIGRYVRVWNSAKTRKARGKMIEVRKKKVKGTEQGKQGEMGNISAEDIYHLGVTLGLKPTKDERQMIDLIEGRL